MKFHTFTLKEIATLIVVEPVPSQFVWLYLYVAPRLRNGLVSTELAKYALYTLIGEHHIHWLRNIKSFQKLATELNWETHEDSELFQKCNYSKATDIDGSSYLLPLFKELVRHKISLRKPNSLKYTKRQEEKKVLSKIRRAFLKNEYSSTHTANIPAYFSSADSTNLGNQSRGQLHPRLISL